MLSETIKSIEEDRERLEKVLGIEFQNPAVRDPLIDFDELVKSAKDSWDQLSEQEAIALSDKAIRRQIESLLNAYRTAAGYLIREARFSIEDCTNDIEPLLQHHESARMLYTRAADSLLAYQNDNSQFKW